MELSVVIEPLPDRPGFTAYLAGPIQLSAQADTANEAHRQLAALLERRMREGRALSVPGAAGHGSDAGWLPDDELTRNWLGHVQSYRDECDAADRAERDEGLS